MHHFLVSDYANPSQPYSISRDSKRAVSEARETIAKCIGAEGDEIFFTSGGTESDNWALKCAGDFSRRRVITSAIEHHAVLRVGEDLKRDGGEVSYLPVLPDCTVNKGELEKIIDDNTRLVSVMLANNETGALQDIASLSDIAHRHGALFHTDGVQAAGHINIDVKSLGVDMLSASAHKFNGPKGIGFLYVKNGTKIHSFISGGKQERGMRAGTENVASIVGMATALKKNADSIDDTAHYLHSLEDIIIEELKGIDYIRNGSANHLPGSLSLSFPGKDGEALLHVLDLKGICISTGAACDSKNTQISHVLKAMNVPEEYAKGTVRITLGPENTKEDARRIGKELGRVTQFAAQS